VGRARLFATAAAATVIAVIVDFAIRWRARLAALFFRNFFHLLLIVAGLAQWACVAWFLWVLAGVSFAPIAHLAAVSAMYVFNRAVVGSRSRRSRSTSAALRVYTAVAFIALFCFAFLLTSGTVWLVLRSVLGALIAQASNAAGAALAGHGIDRAFAAFVTLGMGSIALLLGYGYVFGQHELRVTEVALPVRGFGKAGAGLRIAHLSDIHIGQNLSMAQLEKFVARANALAPDLVCITGDIADSPSADLARFLPVLGQLRAAHGVVAILGNHDHYAGADRVVAELERWTDFRVLRDSSATLYPGGRPLHVIGLDDRGRDWARGIVSCSRLAALVARAPAEVPILLLSHRPDIFPQAAAAGVALTLSGHTHGGQLALPWFGGRRRNLAEFVTPFSRGLYERAAAFLYVNSGLGVTGQRIRLFTPREIALFDLGCGGPDASASPAG
jgi:uncharacterized protein